MVGEALEVLLLLGNLLLELAELLILTLADGQVLAGALPALEGVTTSLQIHCQQPLTGGQMKGKKSAFLLVFLRLASPGFGGLEDD